MGSSTKHNKLKYIVFTMDSEMSNELGQGKTSYEKNQEASDELAGLVGYNIEDVVDGKTSFDKQRLFELDVGSAVKGLGLEGLTAPAMALMFWKERDFQPITTL